MKRMTVLASCLLGVVIALGAAPAYAAETGDVEVHPEVATMLAEVPGGVAVDYTHAVWPRLGMELAVRDATSLAARSVGSCATNRICAFNGSSLGGSMLSFSTCTVSAIPGSFTTRSVANARGSGYVQARNASTVLATVNAGNWANVSGTVTNLRCVL
jgi:hypothetical protein